jgi:uncharacterized membrane protein (DUF106 family)
VLIFTYTEPFDLSTLIVYPLGSTFFVIILSLTVSLISAFLTTKLVDTEELNRKQLLIKKHQEEKAKIIELADTNPKKYKKEVIKWKRKEQFIKNIQQGIAMQRLKPTCITFLPMIIIFGILNVFFGRLPVACSPMNANDILFLGEYIWAATDIPINGVVPNPPAWTALVFGITKHIDKWNGWIQFTAWYFLCSFTFNTLVQRLLGLQTQATGGMESMFKGMGAATKEFPDV